METVQVEHQDVVKNLGLEERVFKTTPRPAFITVKDHKAQFQNDPKARLLNPTKPEIGKVSKQILENVINVIRKKTKLNSWKNTGAVLMWFKNFKRKTKKSFIVFDICSYYSCITPELMSQVLDWAEQYIKITKEERNVIMQSKKSFLYSEDTSWVKMGDKNFDVGMGAYDGAESADLIGLFLLDVITKTIKDIKAGCSMMMVSPWPRLPLKILRKFANKL